jgi:hypothetical protein
VDRHSLREAPKTFSSSKYFAYLLFYIPPGQNAKQEEDSLFHLFGVCCDKQTGWHTCSAPEMSSQRKSKAIPALFTCNFSLLSFAVYDASFISFTVILPLSFHGNNLLYWRERSPKQEAMFYKSFIPSMFLYLESVL